MEDRKAYYNYLHDIYFPQLPEGHNFDLQLKNPYTWTDYIHLTDGTRVLDPGYQTRDKLHSNFLFTGLIHNEALVMQFLSCMANQNWLQRFGNVKMLLWIPNSSAVKIMARPDTRERAKCSVVRETFCDAKLIATPDDEKSLKSFNNNLLSNDDPIIFNPKSFSKASKYTLIEFNPKDHDLDAFAWDYVVKQLMASRNTPLDKSLNHLGPAAADFFVTKIPLNLLGKVPKNLTSEEFKFLLEVFQSWPFKPDSLLETVSFGKEM
ncbi:Mitochondrial replication protein MTF1 [Wickerhamomyces ciferrii]|uniref:rRNA adenine N(6)-methyltransferase n=1 Tax=Wickerhamomyces ciferrii (strain ATCC 14091 / BCRC 22168 / CBS 111 / JCM 3599 / NBRC 0793 / NRRL Y-1031 F-60-10) TaxID=1206466 RepID=K0KVK6_WICCF|nr:Mitochondrial replication protein MTF1 [Wickerhamomyces ciferrii]CCH45504.1 Mitochondrial replication protein MTF1 [Wickerhamomyces ciferrii]